MPIEIRELVIRATVDEGQAPGGEASSGSESDRDAIIRECVEQVMERLKEKEER